MKTPKEQFEMMLDEIKDSVRDLQTMTNDFYSCANQPKIEKIKWVINKNLTHMADRMVWRIK